MKNQKGSLILSLVAAGSVAATIVATHQVAQNFASGAGQKFSQQQAFSLAQKSLAVSALMVNMGIIACSYRPITEAEERRSSNYNGRAGQPEGCRLTPQAAWPNSDEYAAVRKLYTEDGFNLSPEPGNSGSYFENSWLKQADSQGNLSTNADPNKGARSVIFRPPSDTDSHKIFKRSKITWSISSVKAPEVQSAFDSLSKGYICWEKNTFKVRKDGFCPALDPNDKESMENILATKSDQACTTEEGGNTPLSGDTLCDYYPLSDQSQGVVFLKVESPYGGADEGNAITLSAILRRPMAIVKLFPAEKGTCFGNCEAAERPNIPSGELIGRDLNGNWREGLGRQYEGKNMAFLDLYPRCAGMSRSSSGSQAERGREGVALDQSKIKVKNFGPGILYNLSLRREDIDNYTNNVLSHQLVNNNDEWSFQKNNGEWAGLLPGKDHILTDHVPCYRSHYYNKSVKMVSCSYRMNRFDEGHFPNGTTPTACADGAVCDSAKHDVFAAACGVDPTSNPIFKGFGSNSQGQGGGVLYNAPAVGSVVQNLAAKTFTPVPTSTPSDRTLPALANSVRSNFNDANCIARSGGDTTYFNNLCKRKDFSASGNPNELTDFGRSAMGLANVRPGIVGCNEETCP